MEYVSENKESIARRERMKLEAEQSELQTIYQLILDLASSSPLRNGETLIQRYDSIRELKKHHETILSALSAHEIKPADNEHHDR